LTLGAKLLWELFKIGMGVWIAIVGVMIANEFREKRCEARWSQSGYTTKFETWNGCFVQMGGSWIPEANVQVNR
jgi:hypothetical protein